MDVRIMMKKSTKPRVSEDFYPTFVIAKRDLGFSERNP
jgi:hypothetical protein